MNVMRAVMSGGKDRERAEKLSKLKTALLTLIIFALWMLLFLLVILAIALSAHGQQSPQMSSTVQMATHPARATQVLLATPQNLLPTGSITVASGEMISADIPITEPKPDIPLGTIARQYRVQRTHNGTNTQSDSGPIQR